MNKKKPSKNNAPEVLVANKPDIKSNRPDTKIPDILRINLAIGVLTVSLTIFLLYLVNYLIFTNYHPDIAEILNKVVPLSVLPPKDFFPEPVERMQFQVSLLCTPLFIIGSFMLMNKGRNYFLENPYIATAVNFTGILIFLFYLSKIFSQNLVYLPNETTVYFFKNSLIGSINAIVMIVFYAAFIYFFFLNSKSKDLLQKKLVINIISYLVVAITLLDLFFYNFFHWEQHDWGRLMETNAVFYSITQVYAGKSLLVDFNSQYGLYAWLLCPVFKIIGLTAFKFSIVMALLDCCSFFLLFLGLKKIIKNDLVALITFLCVFFWQYWQPRLPHEATAHPYYQYAPIRIIFACIGFYLLTSYQTGSQAARKFLLPLIALTASFGILWNMDTGLVVYGAVFVGLLVSAFDPSSMKESGKRALINSAWMIGALLFVFALFMAATKINSGALPDFQKFAAFQTVFYVSGFFMLPMGIVHFWNLPMLVYLIACSYCVYSVIKAGRQEDVPVIAFLFILGMGIFAYFQGRSFDINLDVVIYPAIILLGIFCNKLLAFVQVENHKFKFHESVILFLIPFIFLADGAFSMIYWIPEIHSFAVDNAFSENPEKEQLTKKRIEFINANIPKKDTVLILAKDYDSYYYASGEYFNPLNIPGSTEVFFKSEIDSLVSFLQRTKYPIIYDANHTWLCSDTILYTLSKYTTIQKQLENDQTLILIKPGKTPTPNRLTTDAHTVYYNELGEFSKYVYPTKKLTLPENFSIEFIISMSQADFVPNNLIFSNTAKAPFSGFFMSQYGADPRDYLFTYGNGSTWCTGATVKLSADGEYHLLVKVERNIINIFNNGTLVAQGNTNSMMRNSDGVFFINPGFKGKFYELKISVP